ncbi:MAG: hypothetical protein GX196_05680 [Clostridiaceae bacterium]|nr:hypothetical protein [Clostridiaceae bacterium]
MGSQTNKRGNKRKLEDGNFRSKKIKHTPEAESSRAVFGKKENNQREDSF